MGHTTTVGAGDPIRLFDWKLKHVVCEMCVHCKMTTAGKHKDNCPCRTTDSLDTACQKGMERKMHE